MVNLINGLRVQAGLGALGATTTPQGVAVFHAKDMAQHNYVGFVASDGEDVFRRLTCSGGMANVSTGVIAVGGSSSPNAVFDALQNDISSKNILLGNNFFFGWTSLTVGYSGGHWMIIFGR